MNEKIKKLGEWGCNIEEAMSRMLNDEEFYLDCLQTIITDDNFDGLKNSLVAGDIKQSFDHAHALKGVLANLSLTPMTKKVVEIVEPLRAGNADGLIEKTDELLEMKKHLESILID